MTARSTPTPLAFQTAYRLKTRTSKPSNISKPRTRHCSGQPSRRGSQHLRRRTTGQNSRPRDLWVTCFGSRTSGRWCSQMSPSNLTQSSGGHVQMRCKRPTSPSPYTRSRTEFFGNHPTLTGTNCRFSSSHSGLRKLTKSGKLTSTLDRQLPPFTNQLLCCLEPWRDTCAASATLINPAKYSSIARRTRSTFRSGSRAIGTTAYLLTPMTSLLTTKAKTGLCYSLRY
nr:hypothetical 26K protein - foxtail mosaic virus [Foxtail mosaic virus]